MLAIPRHLQRPPPDKAGAQQGRQGRIIALFAQGEAIASVGNDLGGKATIARIAVEQRPVAKVFVTRRAIMADTTGPAQPRDADPLTQPKSAVTFAKLFHPANNLGSGDHRQGRLGQLTVHNMQICSADPARRNPDADLSDPRMAAWQCFPLQRLA